MTKFLLSLLHQLNRWRYFVTRPITVGVRVLLIREKEVLLVKHTYEPYWYIPGGGVKKGETITQAIRREAAEEVGATLEALRLFGVYTNFYEYKSDHVIVFVCEEFTVKGQRSLEIEHFDFFQMDNVPQNISPGSHRRIIEYSDNVSLPIVGEW